LGAVQPLGGPREALLLGDGKKCLQLMNVHKVQPYARTERCTTISVIY
jgi:hypothetical protein